MCCYVTVSPPTKKKIWSDIMIWMVDCWCKNYVYKLHKCIVCNVYSIFTETYRHITPKKWKCTKCTMSLQNSMYTLHQCYVHNLSGNLKVVSSNNMESNILFFSFSSPPSVPLSYFDWFINRRTLVLSLRVYWIHSSLCDRLENSWENS